MRFSGPIPDWLDPEVDGHSYHAPPPLNCFLPGYIIRDDATYAYAPSHLKQELVCKLTELDKLGISSRVITNSRTTPDSGTTHFVATYQFGFGAEVVRLLVKDSLSADGGTISRNDIRNTPQGEAIDGWSRAVEAVRKSSLLDDLKSGNLRAFGERNNPGNYPEWITPKTWNLLEPDKKISCKFVGENVIYYQVKVINRSGLMILARDAAHEATLAKDEALDATLTKGAMATLLQDDFIDSINQDLKEKQDQIVDLKNPIFMTKARIQTLANEELRVHAQVHLDKYGSKIKQPEAVDYLKNMYPASDIKNYTFRVCADAYKALPDELRCGKGAPKKFMK